MHMICVQSASLPVRRELVLMFFASRFDASLPFSCEAATACSREPSAHVLNSREEAVRFLSLLIREGEIITRRVSEGTIDNH